MLVLIHLIDVSWKILMILKTDEVSLTVFEWKIIFDKNNLQNLWFNYLKFIFFRFNCLIQYLEEEAFLAINTTKIKFMFLLNTSIHFIHPIKEKAYLYFIKVVWQNIQLCFKIKSR